LLHLARLENVDLLVWYDEEKIRMGFYESWYTGDRVLSVELSVNIWLWFQLKPLLLALSARSIAELYSLNTW
jgi:hypothetical protein